ncbi:MAG: SOS response-associated peptidase family protein [Cyclobacteriaceae bacterium]
MYNSYALFSELDVIKTYFSCGGEIEYSKTYLATPTERLPVVLAEDLKLEQLYWGVTNELAKGKSVSRKLVNLPIEQALERPMYRKLISARRCVIPSNGFYLWKQISKKQRTPYFVHLIDNQLFGIAGIWDEYEDFEGNISHTFNMILTLTDNKLSSYHEERPAVLTKEASQLWLQAELDPDLARQSVLDFDENLLALHAVNPKCFDGSKDSPEIINPTLPSDQFGNYTLFS